MDEHSLPSFDNPPVTEVVFGVQFKSLRKLRSAHLGAFWSTLRDDYPAVEDVPPLPPVLDRGLRDSDMGPVGVQLTNVPPLPRLFLLDASGSRLIQIQRDRFHHNWRKADDVAVYPRYGTVKQEFLKRWEGFATFLDRESLGPVEPVQYELTYINHVFVGSLWVNILDLGDIVPAFAWHAPKDEFLPVPDGIGWTVSFPCQPCSGHLSIGLKHGERVPDNEQVLVLELTVRGHPSDGQSLDDWFGSAREWIVRGFTAITSEGAHKYWQRSK